MDFEPPVCQCLPVILPADLPETVHCRVPHHRSELIVWFVMFGESPHYQEDSPAAGRAASRPLLRSLPWSALYGLSALRSSVVEPHSSPKAPLTRVWLPHFIERTLVDCVLRSKYGPSLNHCDRSLASSKTSPFNKPRSLARTESVSRLDFSLERNSLKD